MLDSSSIPRKVIKWLVVIGVSNANAKGDNGMRLFLHMRLFSCALKSGEPRLFAIKKLANSAMQFATMLL